MISKEEFMQAFGEVMAKRRAKRQFTRSTDEEVVEGELVHLKADLEATLFGEPESDLSFYQNPLYAHWKLDESKLPDHVSDDEVAILSKIAENTYHRIQGPIHETYFHTMTSHNISEVVLEAKKVHAPDQVRHMLEKGVRGLQRVQDRQGGYHRERARYLQKFEQMLNTSVAGWSFASLMGLRYDPESPINLLAKTTSKFLRQMKGKGLLRPAPGYKGKVMSVSREFLADVEAAYATRS